MKNGGLILSQSKVGLVRKNCMSQSLMAGMIWVSRELVARVTPPLPQLKLLMAWALGWVSWVGLVDMD